MTLVLPEHDSAAQPIQLDSFVAAEYVGCLQPEGYGCDRVAASLYLPQALAVLHIPYLGYSSPISRRQHILSLIEAQSHDRVGMEHKLPLVLVGQVIVDLVVVGIV